MTFTDEQVPRINCKESALLLAHFAFLIGRTWLSLIVARLDGAIVRDLVAANGKGFAKGLIYWFLIAIPASYNNAMVNSLEAILISRLDSLSSIQTLHRLQDPTHALRARLVPQLETALLQNSKLGWWNNWNRPVHNHRHCTFLRYCRRSVFHPRKTNRRHVGIQLPAIQVAWITGYLAYSRQLCRIDLAFAQGQPGVRPPRRRGSQARRRISKRTLEIDHEC
jgi:hypothetical protein